MGSRGTGGHREEFNDTVFEVLGAENSKNDVVEFWGGGGGWGSRGMGGHWKRPGRGGSSTTPFLRFWELKTPKTMSLNSREGWGGGGFTAEGGSPGTRGENKKCDKTLSLTFISYSRGRLEEIFRVSTKNIRFLSN